MVKVPAPHDYGDRHAAALPQHGAGTRGLFAIAAARCAEFLSPSANLRYVRTRWPLVVAAVAIVVVCRSGR